MVIWWVYNEGVWGRNPRYKQENISYMGGITNFEFRFAHEIRITQLGRILTCLKNAVFDQIHRYFDDLHHFRKNNFSDP